MADFPLPDTDLPALKPLLTGELWQRWSTEGRVFPLDDFRAAVGYLRLKPHQSCRVTVVGGIGGKGENPPEGFLLHLYTDPDRAASAYQKLIRRESVIGEEGYEPFFERDLALVAAPFPNDRELPHLRQVYDPKKFRRSLSATRPKEYPAGEWRLQRRHMRTKLLAYKPGRRAVFRVRVGLRHEERDEKVRAYWHLKVCTPNAAKTAHEMQSEIHAAVPTDAEWRVPAPLGFVEEMSLVSTEWVRGKSLGDRIAESDDAAHDSFRRIGRALAEYHRLPVSLPPVGVADSDRDALRSLGEDLEALFPEPERLARLADTLATRHAALCADASGLAHGDFHPEQILFADGKTIIVDHDRAGHAPPVFDLGEFSAGIEEREWPASYREAFLDGYAEVSERPDPRAIADATAIALFRRAVFPFRTLVDNWPTETERLIASAERLTTDGFG